MIIPEYDTHQPAKHSGTERKRERDEKPEAAKKG